MKKSNLLVLFAILFSGAFFIVSCTEEPGEDPEPSDDDSYTYTTHASPIFNNFCATSGCHVSGAGIGSLANYDDAKAFAQGGRILGSIKHENGYSPMPKNDAKLSDQMIETIEKWINDGLKE